MKKVITFIILALFLFNLGGYYILFWALRIQSNSNLMIKIETGDIAEYQTIELKIPMGLPYPLINQRGFERAMGKFEYNGEFYTLVKSQYKNDTLYIVCLKNHVEKRLTKVMYDYGKLTNNASDSDSQTMSFLSKLSKDYHETHTPILAERHPLLINLSFTACSSSILDRHQKIISPPPEG